MLKTNFKPGTSKEPVMIKVWQHISDQHFRSRIWLFTLQPLALSHFWTCLPTYSYLPTYVFILFLIRNLPSQEADFALFTHPCFLPQYYFTALSVGNLLSLSRYKEHLDNTYPSSYYSDNLYWWRYGLINSPGYASSYTPSHTTIMQVRSHFNLINTFKGCISTLSPIHIRLYWSDRITVNQILGRDIRLWYPSYP